MIAIVDNDVIAKLARYSLLKPFEKYLNKKSFSIKLQPRIDATFDLAAKSAGLKKVITVAQRDEITALALRSGRVALNELGRHLVDSCYLVERIDTGDAVWLSAAASEPSSIAFTGDKKALRAVIKEARCDQIVNLLAARVVCFEQIIINMIEQEGIVMVRKFVRDDPEADLSVYSAFNSKTVNSADATAALNAIVTSLRNETGTLLHP